MTQTKTSNYHPPTSELAKKLWNSMILSYSYEGGQEPMNSNVFLPTFYREILEDTVLVKLFALPEFWRSGFSLHGVYVEAAEEVCQRNWTCHKIGRVDTEAQVKGLFTSFTHAANNSLNREQEVLKRLKELKDLPKHDTSRDHRYG